MPTAGWGSDGSIRALVPTANSMVNVNRPTLQRITLLRRSAVAMMRDVSWPLATWIAIRINPKVKTMNDIISVSTAFSASDVPGPELPNEGIQLSQSGRPNTTRIAMFSSTTAIRGAVQGAELI